VRLYALNDALLQKPTDLSAVYRITGESVNLPTKIPCASPFCMRLSISLKTGRPGILAVRFSTNSAAPLTISSFSLAAIQEFMNRIPKG